VNTSFNNKKIIWIFAFMVLSFWLINANSIVASLFVAEGNQIHKVKLEDYETKSPVYINVTGESSQGDLFDIFSITGGAFCETDQSNSQRSIVGILKSDKGVYAAQGVSAIRPDIYYMFSDTKQIGNGEVGFQLGFSTINIPNGVYQLYIYVHENDEAYGLANSGYKYIKDNHGFRPYDYGASVDLEKITTEEERIPFRFDELFIQDDGTLHVKGWQYLNDIDCADTNIYLKITSPLNKIEYFELKKFLRIDIFNIFGDKYLLSGLSADVDFEFFETGIYTMHIIVENNSNYYISTEYEVVTVDKQNITAFEHRHQ